MATSEFRAAACKVLDRMLSELCDEIPYARRKRLSVSETPNLTCYQYKGYSKFMRVYVSDNEIRISIRINNLCIDDEIRGARLLGAEECAKEGIGIDSELINLFLDFEFSLKETFLALDQLPYYWEGSKQFDLWTTEGWLKYTINTIKEKNNLESNGKNA